MLTISFQPEYVLSIGDFRVSNSLLTTVLVTLVLTLVAIYFYVFRTRENLIIKSIKAIIYELLKLIDQVTGDRKLSTQVLPLIATFFIFIFTANLFALVPGFLGSFFVKSGSSVKPLLRSPNSDLNTTLALALIAVLAIQAFSLKILGLKGFVARFINFRSFAGLVTGFFEMISEGIKVLSFSFRLFGNIFAGEVLLIIIAFLVPYIIPLPFMFLEIFVGIIQAFIFAMLTLTFIKTSTIKHTSQNQPLHRRFQELH